MSNKAFEKSLDAAFAKWMSQMCSNVKIVGPNDGQINDPHTLYVCKQSLNCIGDHQIKECPNCKKKKKICSKRENPWVCKCQK
jgi:hypothetical protein